MMMRKGEDGREEDEDGIPARWVGAGVVKKLMG